MLNILMPMAGRATRFTAEGVRTPKPLIPVRGVPMGRAAVNNVRPSREHRFVFCCLESHCGRQDSLSTAALEWAGWQPQDCVVPVPEVTLGAACTCLLAECRVPPDEPLLIANCDQWIEHPVDEFLGSVRDWTVGAVLTFPGDSPKLSYVVRRPTSPVLLAVVEKQVVSREATAGWYWWRESRLFFDAARDMVTKGEAVNGEYYVAPCYNRLIMNGMRVASQLVNARVWGLDSPGLVKEFEAAEPSELWRKLNG